MRLIRQSFEIMDLGAADGMEILRKIEKAGRTCYKSEDQITDDSATGFVERILKSGHHSVIEHHNITVRIVTNRGVTHELVRHRLCSFSQESTRYVKYGGKNGIVFILPVWMYKAWDDCRLPLDKNLTAESFYALSKFIPKAADLRFMESLDKAERDYKALLDCGWKPQEAREILPNALKTEIVVTANLREWRHIFRLRCSKTAHPQIRDLMMDGLNQFSKVVPILFNDI